MDKSLTKYIWKHTRAQQIWILIVVAVSMYTYFLSFDLPKEIINGPINGRGFEAEGAVQTYLDIAFDLPLIGHVQVFPGIQVERVQALMLLSGLFLLLVIVNGGFKFYINTYKGRLGERMLRRIRFELVDRILRFPPEQFKRVKPSEMATMVKDEVEPLGGFIGDAFVQPALLCGQALTALVFIVIQDHWLGFICTVIVAIQIFLIPRLRRRLLVLGRLRQLTARELSGRIGEISEGISSVHVHNTSNFERADVSTRLGRIFKIRFDLYQWKFLIKFINNFLAQVTPFLFYVIGGYQVIKGELDVGQLIAVIAAYKDLPGPLKELIDWDQIRQDVNVKYTQVYEQFAIGGIMDPALQSPDVELRSYAGAPLSVIGLTALDDSGGMLLHSVTATIHPGQLVGVISTSGAGGEAFVEALARIIKPSSGKVQLGPDDIFALPEAIVGRNIGYASHDAFLFQGTLRDNLFYGLKHSLSSAPEYGPEEAKTRQWEIAEAIRSGNTSADIHGDWIDYAEAGASGPHDIMFAALPVLESVCLDRDVFDFGLRSSVHPSRFPAISEKIVQIRADLRKQLVSESLDSLIVPLDPAAYNTEATIGENLLFGAISGTAFSSSVLLEDRQFVAALVALKLTEPLYDIGMKIASNALDILSDLPPDHPAFQKLGLMPPEEVAEYQKLLGRVQNRSYDDVVEGDRLRIIALSLSYLESRHRFGLLTPEFKSRIVATRRPLRELLPPKLRDTVEPYDPEQYNAAATLLDNLLFGRIKQQEAEAEGRILSVLSRALHDQNLTIYVIALGLEYQVGVGGKKLTAGQRQKLNLARALLKRPAYLILNRPLSALDQATQAQVLSNVVARMKRVDARCGLVVLMTNPDSAHFFHRVFNFDRGVLHDTVQESDGQRSDDVRAGVLV
jgi:putative ABC transport system ATP-binding protein